MLIDSAVKGVKGDMSEKDDLRTALTQAQFESNRGKFAYNSNNFPIQDYYVREVVKDEDGVLVTKTHRNGDDRSEGRLLPGLQAQELRSSLPISCATDREPETACCLSSKF